MKKHGMIFAAFLGITLLLGSCADIFAPPEVAKPEAGKGRLAILLEGGGRTALPSGDFDRYVLRFSYEGGGYTHEEVEWIAGVSVDLEPGTWTIYADAYKGSIVSGMGSASVTVNAGLTVPVTIRIGVINAGAGTGTLRYTVSYPTEGADHAYDTQTLTAIAVSGGGTVSTAIIMNGVPGSIGLAAGVYVVTVIVEDTVQRTRAQKAEAAHIYAGEDTVLEISIGAGEFVATIPLTGTVELTVPSGVTVSGRVIRAYNDADCTEPLGSTGGLGVGTQDFILWIPSKNSGMVYLRQEIEVGGVWVSGTVLAVTIQANQGEALAVNFPSGGDIFYAVEISTSITGGTVTPGYWAAVLGTEVTLTVTPDHGGAVLKPGTLKVNGGTVSVAGSGDSYSFTMPATDVTVTAEFLSGWRYVRETAWGTGDGSSWTNASNDLQKMMDEAAAAKAAGAAEAVVRVAAGTYYPKWDLVDLVVNNSYTPGGRDSVFFLRAGVEVRGSYPAGGGDDTSRNPEARSTILSGDIGTLGDDADNTYHVVMGMAGEGSLPLMGESTVLDGLTITGGNANVDGDITFQGGGILLSGASPALTNVTITGNKAITGGGLALYESSPVLTNVTITGNSAVYVTTGGNDVGGIGGGMYNCDNSSPVLNNVTISNNTSTGGTPHTGQPGGGGGAGMYNDENSSPVLTDVIITYNTTTNTSGGGGAGMYNNDHSSPVLTDVTISNNTSTGNGGGMYNEDYSSPVLTDVIISNNTSNGGGGMYNEDYSSPVLTNVVISGNTSSWDGGGMKNLEDCSPVLTNVLITGNSATNSYGGGMLNVRSSLVLTNVLIAGNVAGVGGGMSNENSSLVLTNVTISGNKASHSTAGKGGGIYNNSAASDVRIRNSIIWGNTAVSSDSGIGVMTNVTTGYQIAYSIVQGISGTYPSYATDNGGNTADPGVGSTYSPFVDWQDPADSSVAMPNSAGNYRLKDGSPAIDAGSNNYYGTGQTPDLSAITTDLDGTNRIKGSTIDMGAYEKE